MDLEVLWYGVIGVSILMYVMLDGFDLGVGALHLFARTDTQRRIFLNAIGPVWDGNEVWIVIVMGALFAGFPNAYATIFSGFYSLLMMLIAGLMFRACSIEFRSKRESMIWREFWDIVFSLSSVLVTFVLGLLLGNAIQGIDIDEKQNFVGQFSDFFQPYPILIGITAVALCAMHGAVYLNMKTSGSARMIVRQWIFPAILFFILWYIVATLATLIYMPHMVHRIQDYPTLFLFPVLALLAIISIPYQIHRGRDGWAFVFSCLSIVFLFVLYGLGTFPVILPSTLRPEFNSLTIFNTASSPYTLKVLLIVVLIGIPLVLAYGFWVYRIFRGKVVLSDTSY